LKKLYILSENKLNALIQKRVNEHIKHMNKDYEREILKKQVDIATLQNQINPHFLYNSLECIRGQAILNNAPEIAEITLALSKFFRYGISTKSDIVTLREELDSINNYMKIQQFRFKDSFSLAIDYDKNEPEILDALLPKLTFQPIIENAINHGFSSMVKQAMIHIEIIHTKKHLNINISDNGQGMDTDTLLNLNKRLESDENLRPFLDNQSKNNGLALYNINKRIKLIFGEEYGIHVSSIPNIGTDVEIQVPYKVNDKS
jgi:two-component system sensor histidine kinase YesM